MQGNTAIQCNRRSGDAALTTPLAAHDSFRCAGLTMDAGPCEGIGLAHEHLRRQLDDSRAELARLRASKDHTITALRYAQSELRLVSAALISSQEMERKRIAGELHDSIGQTLGTIGLVIGGALDTLRADNARGAEQMLLRASDQVRQAIGEVRRIAMDLRPATLDNIGIVGTLSWFCREFRAVHADIAVVTDIDIGNASLPSALTTAIYRVVQEASNNVVRHARASRLAISLRRQPDAITLCVEDNGRGLGANDRGGMGLRSMRDRVEFSGGSFEVTGQPGAGTRVVASWPLSGAYCRAHAVEDADAVSMMGELR